jgi:predicted Zn-dependent protease
MRSTLLLPTSLTRRISYTLLLFTSVACVSIPGTDDRAFNLISRGEEKKMGEDAYKEIKAKEKISHNQRWTAMLQRVGKRISKVAPVDDFEWEFTLIESKDMNAFCLPGGKVAFYTGILPVLENEAAMAIVMGHEVAHAVARHGVQRMSQGMVAQGILAGTGFALGDNKYRNLILGGLGVGAQVGVMLPFSRSHETQADDMGLDYAAAAGYDPAEGSRFWQRFSKATGAGGKPPSFLSTHPSDSSRIENLKRLQQRADKLYDKSPQYGLGETI